jgi:hypothetical protein
MHCRCAKTRTDMPGAVSATLHSASLGQHVPYWTAPGDHPSQIWPIPWSWGILKRVSDRLPDL